MTRRALAATLMLLTLTWVCLGCCCPAGGRDGGSILEVFELGTVTIATLSPDALKTLVPALPTPDGGEPFTDIPTYPGAALSTTAERAFQLATPAAGASPIQNALVRAYSTRDSASAVIAFCREQMPRQGWQAGLNPTTGDGGLMQWKKGPASATVAIARSGEETQILISRSENSGC